MMGTLWGFTSMVIAICVAVLAVALVAWAIIAIGLELLKDAGKAKIEIRWLKRMYGRNE